MGGSKSKTARYWRDVALPGLDPAEEARRVALANEYRGLTRVKQFGHGRQSLGVWLLSNGVVAKELSARDEHRFRLEVHHLHRLRNCPFVAHMLSYDPERRLIYTEYAGTPPPVYTSAIKKQVRAHLKTLKREYGLEREFGSTDLPRLANVAIDTAGTLRLIDFGTPWKRS